MLDSCQRIPGNNPGSRHNLRKYTHLWHTTHSTDNSTIQTMGRPNRGRLNGIFTCFSSNRQSLHVATSRALRTRPLHNNSVEAQQSNLRTTQQSKILARPLCQCPTTIRTYTTHKRAQRLQRHTMHGIPSGIR